jgi:hypothetical protein
LGLCRDFTHLAITFCRALNIPARYAFGYLPDMDVPIDPAPMDFAAWMDVWLDDRWWTSTPAIISAAREPEGGAGYRLGLTCGGWRCRGFKWRRRGVQLVRRSWGGSVSCSLRRARW